MHLDLSPYSDQLTRGKDGIWTAREDVRVSYPEAGNDHCFQVEDSSFWFRHRNSCIVAALQAFPPGGPIFDIGGGNGFVARGMEAAGHVAVVVEPGPDGVRNARTRGLENVVRATTDTAGFRPGSLPAVGLFDVIEHVDREQEFLRSVAGLLRDDGRLYATVPAWQALWSAEDIDAGHHRRYTRRSLTAALERAGFEVEFCTYIFSLLPLPVLLARALPWRLGIARPVATSESIARDHGASGGAGPELATRLLKPEIGRIRRRAPIAFGGSVLVVARLRPA
jgi:SAM-dependent methyltransferase